MCKHVLCNLMDSEHVQGIHHWRGHEVEFPRWHVHTRQVETNFSSGVTLYGKGKSNVLVFRKDISLSPENRQPHNHPYSQTVFVFSVKNLYKKYSNVHVFKKTKGSAKFYGENYSKSVLSLCYGSSLFSIQLAVIFSFCVHESSSIFSVLSCRYSFHCPLT